MTSRKFQIYIDGGTMKGVFSIGVLACMQKANVYELISREYGNSAGAMSLAYFLSGQTELGSSVYYEDLTTKFINPQGISLAQAFFQRLRKRIKPYSSQPTQIVDINYLFEIVRNVKKLDIDSLRRRGIPAYAWVYDLKANQPRQMELNSDPLKVLHAAVSVIPWYVPAGNELVDAGIVGHGGLDEFLDLQTEDKKIVILNSYRKTWRSDVVSLVEGMMIELMYPKIGLFRKVAIKEKKWRREVRKARTMPNVRVFMPPEEFRVRSRTTCPKILYDGYLQGRQVGEEVVRYMRDNL